MEPLILWVVQQSACDIVAEYAFPAGSCWLIASRAKRSFCVQISTNSDFMQFSFDAPTWIWIPSRIKKRDVCGPPSLFSMNHYQDVLCDLSITNFINPLMQALSEEETYKMLLELHGQKYLFQKFMVSFVIGIEFWAITYIKRSLHTSLYTSLHHYIITLHHYIITVLHTSRDH